MDFGSQYKNIWAVAWNFHKRHYPVRGNEDAFWESVVSDYKEICGRYRDKPGFELLQALLIAALEEMEMVGGCYGNAKVDETAC